MNAPDRPPHGRPCADVDATELCQFLVKYLIPSLEKLYADHRKAVQAITKLEYMVHYEATSEQVEGPLFASMTGDPPDVDSPPSGPPPFPPPLG